MPVLVTGRTPDHFLGTAFHRLLAFALGSAAACGEDQRLPQRIGTPGGAGVGLEGHRRTGNARRLRRGIQWIDANRAGEPCG
jgi:hypothetical protein